jgi:hypothetical protein
MTTLTWIKSTQNEWLYFLSFSNLSEIRTYGVYVIWHGGQTPRVVYVGQGDICSRLTAHRNDPAITAYTASGPLFVTWAAVSAAEQDGVERFLADQLRPLVGDRHPFAVPIPVNLPWAA